MDSTTPVNSKEGADAPGESGQGLAEYALILAFVALVCVTALGALGNAIASSPGFSLF